jgi:hypothetical protein
MMSPATRPKTPERADFYAAAVYGSIVAAALLAAFRKEHSSAETTLFALLSTMFVFYLGHLWSTIVGERLDVGRAFEVRHAVEIARAEWPLVEAAFVPSVALVLGRAGVLSRDHAVDAAAAICVLQLVGWGFVVGHRAYDKWWQAVLAGLVDGGLGVAIVALELAIVH